MEITKLTTKSVAEILSLERRSKKFGLENIRRFLKLIGNPEKRLKIIHVAGTNGKGSVCSMISSCLVEAGLDVGLYTSPHLVRVNERVKVNGKEISDDELEGIAERVLKTQEESGIDLTFFETMTVIAFVYFNERKVDYAVLEAGMGGRLDATNVGMPLVSAITNIGLEHTDVLGRTIAEIAGEKSGIIKENGVVVTGAKGRGLLAVRKAAEEKGARLVVAKNSCSFKLGLRGSYQSENAAVAAAVLDVIGIAEDAVRRGLEKARWPGRFDFFRENLLLDCAHNSDGISALARSLSEISYESLILVFGVMKDKNLKAMSNKLKVLKAKSVIATMADVNGARSPEEVAAHFEGAYAASRLCEAIDYAREICNKRDLIVVTGSVFLVGEAIMCLEGKKACFAKNCCFSQKKS